MIYINLLHVRRRPRTCELRLGVGMPGCRYRLDHHKPTAGAWASVATAAVSEASGAAITGAASFVVTSVGLPGTEAIVLIASSGGAEAELAGGRKNLLRGFGSGVLSEQGPAWQ